MKKNKKLIILAVIVVILLALGACYFRYCDLTRTEEPKPLTDVTVQLKWVHQAQFAGMYVAKEKGFYEEEGLNVTLLPFSYEEKGPNEKVADGDVQFGVTGSPELISARAEGKPVKAVAVIYKTSPSTLYSLKERGIRYPKDLLGKTLGYQSGTDGPMLYRAMMKTLGLSRDTITEKEIGYTADELIAGDVDVAMGYIINEPHQAIEAGYEVNNILMADYGANAYGDVLIASDDMIADNPDLVHRFVRATLRGWEYALRNIDEAIPIILKYAQDRTWSHEQYMLSQSAPLIHAGERQIGWMEEDEWQNVHDMLLEEGIITQPLDVNTLYTNDFLE